MEYKGYGWQLMEKLPYPAYVNIRLKPLTKEHQQELRSSFYSPKGKIARHDGYVAYCKHHKLQHDPAPEGYWGSKEEPWHKPVGIGLIVAGYFGFMASKVVTSGIRTRITF